MLYTEQSVCGAILVDSRCLGDIRDNCNADDFKTEWGKAIFQTACTLKDSKKPVDAVTIRDKTGLDEKLLMDLMDLTPSAANAGEYAKTLHKESMLDEISAVSNDALESVLMPDADPVVIASEAVRRLKNIDDGTRGDLSGTETSLERFMNYRAAVESGEITTVPTGFGNLDRMLGGGLINKGLYILAARPGNCKTTLALKVAEHNAKTGDVLFISLEMDDEQIMARRLSDRCTVPIARLMNEPLTEEENNALGISISEIAESKLTVNRKATATVSEISWWAQRLPDLRLIVIDYLGLIMPEGKHKSLYESVTEISNNLKRMARRLGVPVLCLAQVNRASEGRQGKRPTMADLRDSGAIEQDADAVLILHRPEKDLNKERWVGETLELYVDKNRHGETGKVTFDFYGANGKIIENGKF